jgi:hypothetical protein
MPIITTKGQLYSIETVVIVIAWLLVLVTVWNHTNEYQQTGEWKWNHSIQLQQAISQSDAIILQNHSNPWNGCAVVDRSQKRTKTHILKEGCLQKLSDFEPFFPVKLVQIATKEKSTVYYENRMLNEQNCQGISRPVLMENTLEAGLLEIVICNE